MAYKVKKYFKLDAKFAQSLVDIIAAELNQNVIIWDNHGVIIAAYIRERISSLHECSVLMLKSGKIQEFAVTDEDEKRYRGVRKGFNVPVLIEGYCVGGFGVTGEPDRAAPYARLAAHFVQAALESNLRKEKLMHALQEKRKLQSTLLNKMIEVQEEERRKISRELHDETSQSLTSIIVGLWMLAEQMDDPAKKEKIVVMRNLVAKTLDDVHCLALELRPVLLDDLGLVAAAERYVENYSRQYGIKIDADFASLSQVRFKPEVEITLYRILQETLTNIVKHAKATHIRVALQSGRGKIKLTVADNGIGFNTEALSYLAATNSLGIHGMRERISLLAGEFKIRSTKGTGTAVTVEIPWPKKKEEAGSRSGSGRRRPKQEKRG